MISRKILFKIVIVGDSGVGKSTMVKRLITGKFLPQKLTIGTDLASFSININETKVILQLWDFAGEKKFRFFLPNYSRGAQGCLLCYDVTRYDTFKNLKEWYDIVHENASNPIFVLIAGKQDLADNARVISLEEGEKFRKKNNIAYFFETSSKSGYNIQTIFETLTRAIIDRKNIKI